MTVERPSFLLGLAWVWKHDSAPAHGIYGAVEKDAGVPGRGRGDSSIQRNSFEKERENFISGEWGLSLVGSWRTEPNTYSELAGGTEITVSSAFKISSQKAADVVRGVHPRRAG